MQSSLDHSLFFYDHDFNPGEWMLYVMTSISVGLGRGVVIGRIFDRSGKLCAIATQEGVIRTHGGYDEARSPSKDVTGTDDTKTLRSRL